MKNKTELDLTSGNLFIKVLKYTFPLMMTSIFQLLYTTVDLWTVRKFGGGSLSATAIGSNSALIWLIITIFMNLSIGSNVYISIAKGSNNKDRAHKILHTSYAIAIIGGIIFAIIGIYLSPKLLSLMDTPDSIIEKSTLYLKIYFAGLPFMALFNFGSQMLRALGDSKRPMYFLVIGGIVNVIFDLLFVIVFDMDVAGVGIATVMSQVIAALLTMLWFIKSKECFVNLKIKNIRIDKRCFVDILKIGIPAGIQGIAFSLPNLMIQSSLYSIDSYYHLGSLISQNDIISGSNASGQIEGYVFAMLDAFAMASVSFTGQNFGKKSKKNIIKCYWYCLIWMAIFWVFCIIVCFGFTNQLFNIFVTNDEDVNFESAIIAGKQRMTVMVITYILDGWMDLNSCYLKGLKKSTPPAIVTLLGCTGTRILFLKTIFKLDKFHTVFWLYAAFPISWILVNIVYIPLVIIIQRKQFNTFKLDYE